LPDYLTAPLDLFGRNIENKDRYSKEYCLRNVMLEDGHKYKKLCIKNKENGGDYKTFTQYKGSLLENSNKDGFKFLKSTAIDHPPYDAYTEFGRFEITTNAKDEGDLKNYLEGKGDNIKEIVNEKEMKLIFPAMKKSDREQYLPFINKYFTKFKIDNCKEYTHFFSQVEGEVLQFYYNIEDLSGYVQSENSIKNSVFCTNSTKSESRKYACDNPSEFVGKEHKFANYVYGNMLGNGVPIEGDDDKGNGNGWKYRGRGAHQLTGKVNYKEFNDAIPQYLKNRTVNIIDNPDLVGTDSELYILSAIWHWDSHNGNDTANGKDCSPCECSKVCPDDDCVGAVTHKVNGGCNGIVSRNESFKRIKKTLKCN
jgi:putative chitinase